MGVTQTSPEQMDVLLDRHRTVLVAGGERAGKSWVSGLFGATRTLYGSHFWIVAATYELARPEFDYWCEFLSRAGGITSDRDISAPKIGKCIAKVKSGQIIETKTADDAKKLAAVAPDGIIIAEAAQCTYEVYLKCIGRVAEKRGWLLMSGTFEGSMGWYAEKYTDWVTGKNIEQAKSYSLPSWTNRAIYPGGRQDPEIQRLEGIYSRVEGFFEERIGAKPVPPSSLVFREFRHSVHIGGARYNSALPVYLAVDPSSGGDPYAVLACQFEADPGMAEKPDKIDFCNVIDQYYETNVSTEDIIAELGSKPWWQNVRGGAIDVEAPDERKRWLKYGRIALVSNKVDQFAGIRRLKSFLYHKRDEATGLVVEPSHLRIAPDVTSLPFEFSKYKRKVMEGADLDRESLLGYIVEKPPANQPDHSIKALWYLLIARYGDVKGIRRTQVVHKWKKPQYMILAQ